MRAERKWIIALIFTALFSFVIFISIATFSATYTLASPKYFPSTVRYGHHYPPAFAYYISGGSGQKDQILRLLRAVYHPRNRYLLHLGREASNEERARLASDVMSVPAIQAFGNVDVLGKPDALTYMGSSNIAATLHAAAVLLKLDNGWNWFITLSALDYPLITQDDLSYVFSSVSRDLNFIDHTSELGWKEQQRVRPIVVDPGIYLARRTKIFHATEKRPKPNKFKFFTGSPWVVLSRGFLEYCVFGWDNLPRTLLMYFTNIILSQEGYFHSVVCNAEEFRNTTVNSDLRFVMWDTPPGMEPRHLKTSDFDRMIPSGSAFARVFEKGDPVLSMIDEKILGRKWDRVTPGAWCIGRSGWFADPCSEWGDVNVVQPGGRAERFREAVLDLVDDRKLQSDQCK